MTRTLAVPYVSQITGPGAGGFRNDCGPASVAMFLYSRIIGNRPTIEDLYVAMGVTGDAYINAGQLRVGAARYGLPLTSRYFTMDSLRQSIDDGFPVIALVHYGTFSSLGKTESKFKGPHFLDVVGYSNDSIIVHDPLWRDRGGEYLTWPSQVFYRAWDEARLDGNSSFFGIQSGWAMPQIGVAPQPAIPVPQAPEIWGTGIIIAHAMYIRHTPGGRIVGGVYRGDTVDVLGPNENGWYHIRHGLLEGWCGGNPAYISVTRRPVTSPPAPEPTPEAKKFADLSSEKKWDIVESYLVQMGVVGPDGYVLE